MEAWLNGEFVDWKETNVPLLSHSFSRASAIFEVVDIVATLKGPALFGLLEHVGRFFNSARLTQMQLPITQEALVQAVVDTAKKNKVSEGACKFFAYYPTIELNIIPADPTVNIAIFCIDDKSLGIDRQLVSAPVNVGISSFRKNHPESVFPHAKIVGNYVNSFLSTMEVKKRGYSEAILLDTQGFVAEGPSSNLFFVKDRKIVTPSLRCVLPGITRMAVVEALRDMKYVVRERDIRAEEVQDFDEGFFTSSVLRVRPIRTIEGRKLGDKCPGPVTSVLTNKMVEIFDGRNDAYAKWLTIV